MEVHFSFAQNGGRGNISYHFPYGTLNTSVIYELLKLDKSDLRKLLPENLKAIQELTDSTFFERECKRTPWICLCSHDSSQPSHVLYPTVHHDLWAMSIVCFLDRDFTGRHIRGIVYITKCACSLHYSWYTLTKWGSFNIASSTGSTWSLLQHFLNMLVHQIT